MGDGETGDYLMSYPHTNFPNQIYYLLNCGWLLKLSIQANPESPAAAMLDPGDVSRRLLHRQP